MGTAVATIIEDAYREANIIAIGSSPTTNQQAEALARLNRYLLGVYGFELGEPLLDWQSPSPQRTAPVAANYPQAPYPQNIDASIMPFPMATEADMLIWPYPPKNSRIVWDGTAATIYMPEQPDNGSRMGLVQGSGADGDGTNGNVLTLDGNGRYLGAAGQSQETFEFSSSTPISGHWIYIADQGIWQPIAELALVDNMPFPEKYDDLWVTALMIRLAPRYNKTVSADTRLTFTTMLRKIKAEYRQTGTTVYGSFEFPRGLQSFVAGRWFY